MPGVEVTGPDGQEYEFPDGTDKAAAISYFKKKGIGAAKAASGTVPPPPSSYLSEIGEGIGRGVSNLVSGPMEMMKPRGAEGSKERAEEVEYGPTGRLLLHTGQDIGTGLKNTYKAVKGARQSGEGTAGQVLAGAEQLPFVGGVVQHAEKGGPHMFSPESIGATAEGATYAAAPKVAGKVASTAGKAVGAVGRAADMIGIKSRAGQAFDAVEGKIGDAPVAHEPVHAALDKVFDLGEKGFKVPKVAKSFSKWITERQKSGHTEPAPGGGRVDTGPMTPLTFKDARDFYTAFNESVNWDEVPGGKGGKMGRALQTARHELGKQLAKTAEDNGMGKHYAKAMSDYQRAMKLQNMAGPVGWVGGKVVGHGAGGWVGGVIGSRVGPGIAGNMVRSVTEARRTVSNPPGSDE